MRVAVVLLDRGTVALIERVRERRRYFLFPGGGVEAGEAPEAAAVREAREELGLDIAIERLVATQVFAGNEQRYYLARIVGGTFGSGRGGEMSGDDLPDRGSYRAVRVPLVELAVIDVRPRDLAGMAAESTRTGWPTSVRELSG